MVSFKLVCRCSSANLVVWVLMQNKKKMLECENALKAVFQSGDITNAVSLVQRMTYYHKIIEEITRKQWSAILLLTRVMASDAHWQLVAFELLQLKLGVVTVPRAKSVAGWGKPHLIAIIATLYAVSTISIIKMDRIFLLTNQRGFHASKNALFSCIPYAKL